MGDGARLSNIATVMMMIMRMMILDGDERVMRMMIMCTHAQYRHVDVSYATIYGIYTYVMLYCSILNIFYNIHCMQ